MKLRKFKSNEHGAVVVLVALSLTALFGFTALAVDFGMMASNKQSMQNACDAAALAGAVDLMNGRSGTVTATGYTYAAVNGYDHNDDNIEVTVEQTGTTVKVTIREEMQMGFSGVLTGERTRTVSATATAETTSVFRGCPYALFAESIILVNGSEGSTTINGSMHSNNKIQVSGQLEGNSVATAVGDISNLSGGIQREGSTYVTMPSLPIFEKALSHAAVEVVVYNGDRKNDDIGDFIEDATARAKRELGLTDAYLRENGLYIHIKGNMENVKGDYETTDFPIILIVDGSIKMKNSCTLASSPEAPIYIMSRSDEGMKVTGGDKGFYGILYAPNGDITFEGGAFTFYGSVIAESITKHGGNLHANHYAGIDGHLPNGKVHLVS